MDKLLGEYHQKDLSANQQNHSPQQAVIPSGRIWLFTRFLMVSIHII